MNPFATPVRYWMFQDRIPVGLDEGHVMVGATVHAETGEPLTAVRVFGAPLCELAGNLIAEYCLTELETVELAQRLLGMETWFRPEGLEPPTG